MWNWVGCVDLRGLSQVRSGEIHSWGWEIDLTWFVLGPTLLPLLCGLGLVLYFPGSFSINPFESRKQQLVVAIMNNRRCQPPTLFILSKVLAACKSIQIELTRKKAVTPFITVANTHKIFQSIESNLSS
eukprot:Lithocolla_globosa_v1_NODE_984_length_2990_cov_16.633731.p3 type:complete len:129 gc:universal NODE_984_length_2990_cov_16.633731:2338-1952(-)